MMVRRCKAWWLAAAIYVAASLYVIQEYFPPFPLHFNGFTIVKK
jgi:hypothetical protein